jgi:predicted nucleic acid-binding protein
MSRLLAADTALNLFRGHRHTTAHAAGFAGQLSLSALTVFDIELWVLNARTASRFTSLYLPFMTQFRVLDVTQRLMSAAARLTRHLPVANRPRYRVPAVLAATALEHKLILVTHDRTPYSTFAGLTFEDWSVP